MDEVQWSGCTEPGRMLEDVRGQAEDRTLRLFACACCRRVWRLVPDATGWAAVKVAERFADGLADRRELSVAQLDAERAHHRRHGGAAWDPAGAAGRFAMLACLHAARMPVDIDAAREAAECVRAARRAQVEAEGGENAGEEAALVEARAQADLLRDIIRPTSAAPADTAWLTPAVRSLARAAWEERRLPGGELEPPLLAALADALQEAGCTNAVLLDHLRSAGPHLRGCWALDDVLAG